MEKILGTIIGGLASWKTTLAGVVAALAVLLKTFGIVDIPSDIQTSIVAVAVFFIGFFGKDSTKSGTF